MRLNDNWNNCYLRPNGVWKKFIHNHCLGSNNHWNNNVYPRSNDYRIKITNQDRMIIRTIVGQDQTIVEKKTIHNHYLVSNNHKIKAMHNCYSR